METWLKTLYEVRYRKRDGHMATILVAAIYVEDVVEMFGENVQFSVKKKDEVWSIERD